MFKSICSIDKGGKELIVAVSFSLEASEAVAELRSSFQLKRWEAYARLHKKVNAIAILLLMGLFSHTFSRNGNTDSYFRFLRSGGVHLDMVTGQQIWRGTHYARMGYFIRSVQLKH
jgi:hypothetical protein